MTFIVIPEKELEKAEFKEGDELITKSTKGKNIVLTPIKKKN